MYPARQNGFVRFASVRPPGPRRNRPENHIAIVAIDSKNSSKPRRSLMLIRSCAKPAGPFGAWQGRQPENISLSPGLRTRRGRCSRATGTRKKPRSSHTSWPLDCWEAPDTCWANHRCRNSDNCTTKPGTDQPRDTSAPCRPANVPPCVWNASYMISSFSPRWSKSDDPVLILAVISSSHLLHPTSSWFSTSPFAH